MPRVPIMPFTALFHRLSFYIAIVCVLTACQSTTKQAVNIPAPFFYDQGFAQFSSKHVESEQEIFYIDDVAKNFVHETITPLKNEVDKMEALVSGVFGRSNLNLLYQGDANTVASETFSLRAANCLSMSIMTYALAKEAGFHVNFQKIFVPEYWTRRSGYSLLNGHINLRLIPRDKQDVFIFNPRIYQVDFDPQASRKRLPRKVVSKHDVIAMFYNNKGADALLQEDYSHAYAYFREAALKAPYFNSAWINMGILYRLSGYFQQSEDAYLYALSLEPDNLTAWENLAYLYSITDRESEAKAIIAKVERKRNSNPYYHVNLGEQQIEQKNWERALAHFRKALAVDRSSHEGYFGLARVYFEIGEFDQSERYLKLAKNNAISQHDEDMYQSKLNFLSSL